MYICIDCGHLEEEREEVCHYGDRWSMDYEDYCGDPVICSECGGDIVEASSCDVCGEWMNPENEQYTWCKQCLEDYTDSENILKYINADIGLQREFYIREQFDNWKCESKDAPEELLALCKRRFEDLLNLGVTLPQVKEHTDLMLREFVEGDIDCFYTALCAERREW